MIEVTLSDLKKLYRPPAGSHKGQNGKLLIIGGSHLFHAASLWALEVASRIVDLVHYSSVPENNRIVEKIKIQFRDGIVVPRRDIEPYIEEDDCILIGPGMTRDDETKELTNRLLKKYPQKQWVIDAGALQMLDLALVPPRAILTPHKKEFELLKDKLPLAQSRELLSQAALADQVQFFAKEFACILLVKGQLDLAASPTDIREIRGGNAGMTKGGTGDVLAGLIAALACKNDPFLAAIAGSFINKQAGEALYQKVGPFFNASDLASQIPLTMKEIFFG
ncbi:MAG: NAD(P)H-hydrate dehydratase [Patescibacteria group bacterium]